MRNPAGSGRRGAAPGWAEDPGVLLEPPDRAVDAEERLPDEFRDDENAYQAGLVPPVEEHPEVPEQQERSSYQSKPGHAARDEAGAVHQVAEDQPVSEGDD